MWKDWQKTVRDALPNFAKHPIYVDQGQSVEEFQKIADYVFAKTQGNLDPDGMLRDAEFGARVVETTHGKLTRMWLDSCVEIEFLGRHMPSEAGSNIIDIGAGYGRLAASFAFLIYWEDARYVCVDSVPVSTEVSRQYCARFAPKAEIPSMPDFLALHPRGHYKGIDLAINVHSWNECTRAQIDGWLDLLAAMETPYLFTVSHGQNDASIEAAWYAWEPGRPSFRPLIEKRYDVVAEESIGFSGHPHVLWRRKK